jgi:hypothetical protein
MGICICCCCNKHATNCLENSLIVFNTINFVFYILEFILIEKKCVTEIIYIINIIPFIFLFFNILTLVLVKIFVEFETIFTTQRKLCYIFAYISMALSIICFIFSVVVHSIGSKEIDKQEENQEDNCKKKDIIMFHLCCALTDVLCLIGSFMWYNLMKRIKYCIRGKMIEDRGLINYGVLGAYLGRNNHRNKGKSTGRLDGSQTIYIKNTTRYNSNANSFIGTNKKRNNMNEISERPDEESNISNQEEEKEIKIKGSVDDEF